MAVEAHAAAAAVPAIVEVWGAPPIEVVAQAFPVADIPTEAVHINRIIITTEVPVLDLGRQVLRSILDEAQDYLL